MRLSPRWALVATLLLAACTHQPASSTGGPPSEAPSWPRFHGPDGQNRSTETGLLKEWPKSGPRLIWTAEGIGEGFSSVTLGGGLIYTDGNRDGKTVVTAIDLDGRIKWQKPNGPAWTTDRPGTRGTPTFDSGRVYCESPLGEVVCLDAKTGDKVWDLNILKEFEGRNITWALAESVLVDGDRLICCPGGKKGAVVALDKTTGKTVWASKSTGNTASYASPMLAQQDGLRMVLTMNAKSLIGVNADDGELLFEFPHETRYDVNAFSPLYHDGRIFVSTGYGSGSVQVKVKVDGKKASVEKAWANKELDNHHGGVLLVDGSLYGSSARGKWMCLDWKTGETKYKADGVGKGSLTWADGMLYCYSENRKMGLVKASPEKHEVVSQFEVPSGGEGPSWAHPVVCGGRLYLRHSNKLYAYDIKSRD